MKFTFLKKLFFCIVVNLSVNMQASMSSNFSSFLSKSFGKYNLSKLLIAVPKIEKLTARFGEQEQRRIRRINQMLKALIGLDVGCCLYLKKQQREKYLKNTVNVENVDSELYAIFLKIKKDLGIDEDILFVVNRDDDFKSAGTYYKSFNVIDINKKYKQYSKPFMVGLLNHELEHYRQYNKYVGSYDRYSQNNKPYSEISLKLETGADAAAAGYFDCPECLRSFAESGATDYNVDPNLQSGYFRTKRGYFASEDYKPYIDRACQEGEFCQAHAILSKEDFSMVLDWNSMKFKQKEFPLRYYLPKSTR